MYKFLARPVGQSLPLISLFPKSIPQDPMASKKIATNNSAVNQLVTMLTQAKPVAYSVASASVEVPSHPYGTRRKIWTLAQLYDQTLPVLDNPLYSSEESPAAQTFPTLGSSVCGQLLKEQKDHSSDNSVPSSPR